MAPVGLSGFGLGVAARADVSEGDILGVFVLVGGGLLASVVAGIVSNTNTINGLNDLKTNRHSILAQ